MAYSQPLPMSLDLERHILCAAFSAGDPELCALVIDSARPDDFYSQGHRVIFETLARLGLEHEYHVDTVMLRAALKPPFRECFDEVWQAATTFFTPQSIEAACQRLRALHDARRIVEAGVRICGMALSPDIAADPNSFLDEMTVLLNKAVQERSTVAKSRSIAEVAAEIVEQLMVPPEEYVDDSIPLALDSVDTLVGGLEPGCVYIMAARPGQGKSAYAMQCALRAAAAGKHCLFFAFEMKDRELVARVVAGMAGVNNRLLKRRNIAAMSPADRARIIRACSQTLDLTVQIPDCMGWSIEKLCRHARREKMIGKCDLLVVDYLQLVGSEAKHNSREELITASSRKLKQLAGELNIPVIALSQLSREVESRDGKPQLSDLRFSGAIEEDADVVMFLHKSEEDANLTEFIVGKNRSGEQGMTVARFERSQTRFVDLEDQVL
jgi:replicative DNA helicase